MGQDFIELPVDTSNTGKKVDFFKTSTAQYYRQVVSIGHKQTDDAIAPVSDVDGLRVDVSPSSGIGSLTETAPTTDTASSGLNGRLQRIAQRVTSLIAQIPAALTGSGNFKVAVQESSLSAAAATTDSISAKLATDKIMNGLTELTPKFAKIAAASSGNNTVVAAVSSKKIRVLSYKMSAAGAVNAKWQSAASGTDLDGLNYFDAAGAGVVAPFNPAGWIETVAGELLNLNLSGAVAVGGELTYVEV